MPGTKAESFTIQQLNPIACIGYNNIVAHCGINNIRDSNTESEDQVREVYVDFKTKISEIKQVNPRARMFVCCLLPTKSSDNNRKVKYFNTLLNEDLSRSFQNIRIIDGFSKFTDSLGKLSSPLSREFNNRGEPDYLHLNESGLRVLSVTIKSAIFFRKISGGGTGGGVEQQGGRASYSSALRGLPHRGRRGRHSNGPPSRSRW